MLIKVMRFQAKQAQRAGEIAQHVRYLLVGKTRAVGALQGAGILQRLAGPPYCRNLIQQELPYGSNYPQAARDISLQFAAHVLSGCVGQPRPHQLYMHVILSLPPRYRSRNALGPLTHQPKGPGQASDSATYNGALGIALDVLSRLGVSPALALYLVVHADRRHLHAHVLVGLYAPGVNASHLVRLNTSTIRPIADQIDRDYGLPKPAVSKPARTAATSRRPVRVRQYQYQYQYPYQSLYEYATCQGVHDMGKTSELTYAKVAEAAFYLQANGVHRPSANVVRDYLRDKSSDGVVGAQGQLHKLVKQWHDQQGVAAAANPPPDFSPALRVQLEREFVEIAKKTRQENNDEIAQLREDSDALLRENCAQEQQLVALTQDLSTQVTARDALSGQIGTLTLESLALKAALALAHEAAKTDHFELGQAHSHRQAAQDCAAQKTIDAVQLTEQVQRLQAELSTSRLSAERLQNKLEGEMQARHTADLAHAALQSLQAQLVLQLGSARASGPAKPSLRGRGGHAMVRPGG